LAPFGAEGIVIFQSSRAGTSIVNAIHLPSGDHSSPDGFSVRCVSCVTAPSASINRTKTCAPLGSPRVTYAMRVPSGDHFASDPSRRKRFLVPSTFMIHNDVFHVSLILSIHRRP
jgi:hypothetical protein